MKVRVRSFWHKDPVLFCPACWLFFALLVPPDRAYAGYLDFKVLICLFALMLAVELLPRQAGWMSPRSTFCAGGSRRKLSVLLTASRSSCRCWSPTMSPC
jgi:hypothetical protein